MTENRNSASAMTSLDRLLLECYFCGSPNASLRCSRCQEARYCSTECQAKHWKLSGTSTNHKQQCQRASVDRESSGIDKADYHSYVESLPEKEMETMLYHNYATQDHRLVELADRIRYPLPGPTNQFFRTHEFLQALVAHGEDTDETLTRLYGFQTPPHELIFPMAGTPPPSFVPSPRPWKETVFRSWFQARVAVACGVGAPEGATNALAMGACAPALLPEGVPASNAVLEQMRKLHVPLDVAVSTYGIRTALGNNDKDDLSCSICHETITGTVQLVPNCEHLFHQNCFTEWLKRNASCPLCRKTIPETIPRPPTIQEKNMAARLKLSNKASAEGLQRRPLSETQLDSWTGSFENNVSVVFQLSDQLNFAGGACNIDVSPTGNAIAISSTSIGKIAFLSLDTLPATVTSSTGVGKGFPGGPQSLTFDPGAESAIVVQVDEKIVKYRHDVSTGTLQRVWSTTNGNANIRSLSMDSERRVLVSDWASPSLWISPDGTSKTSTHYESNDDDWESFHARCLDPDCPGGGVLALPNGDIVFAQAVAIEDDNDQVSVGLLRKNDSRIRKVAVQGLTRADLGRFGFAEFCVSPRGDILIAANSSPPRLIRISDPTQRIVRGSCTVLKNFRAFEEFEGICVDKGNCIYLLVVCNWPTEREIYLLNPKP